LGLLAGPRSTIGDPGLLPRVLLPLRADCIESILEAGRREEQQGAALALLPLRADCTESILEAGRREDQNVAALRLCRRLWQTPYAAVDDLKLTAGKDAYALAHIARFPAWRRMLSCQG